MVERHRITIAGVVQGVGFRPFVHGLAERMGLVGWVGNDTDGVVLEAEGPRAVLAELRRRLEHHPPALAVVERVSVALVPPVGDAGFTIAASTRGGPRRTLVSPDVATCDACLAEVADRSDRRHGYAFTNCTSCGPRFTIVRDVPYDRPSTTMAAFAMCAACEREYLDPADRRFHAQPTCCPACGPQVHLLQGSRVASGGDAIERAARLLRDGAVVAVKGLGGYHLAALAADEGAVAALRARKHREERPFALMAADVDAARDLCDVSAADVALLTSPRRPIVLLRRRPDAAVAESVAPRNGQLGVMLPYTPLHHVLVAACGGPLVMTSGNVSDEPIAYRDDDAADRLPSLADAILTHDRPIATRVDDSVVRSFRGGELVLRRARGYAPQPVPLAFDVRRAVLAVGAELKSTFCLATGRRAFVSHHLGDLESYEVHRSFTEGIAHYRRLFDLDPTVVAHDLHPEYLSTKHALDLDGVQLVGVQHHHAHIASCLADNGADGPVIGIAFDGTGYGTDGTLWGGEVLVADLATFERAAHLSAVALPGGAAAIREPWRMALAWLLAAYDGAPPADLAVQRRNADRWAAVTSVARSEATASTSSVGRLFDAVAALAGVRDAITYEGQAAIELEQRADLTTTGAYDVPLTSGGDGGAPLQLDGAALVRDVVDDVCAGAGAGAVSARFHRALADGTVRCCAAVGDRTGLRTVALSGGVFQNVLLLDLTVTGLERAGFDVLVHHRVPPNDGGISLGQATVAATLDRLC